ncbi:MAG TPA: DUF3592 domain-containing protein [Burkholderiaceae bacterium]|jgi:hypothetical protein|nr:DUF3592 domain-containing protein [Burkholderiaceae bacterium]
MLAYKWGTLPVVLLVFFGGQGWDALRITQGYTETSGVITHYSCGKAVVVQFSYTAGDVVHHGSSTSALSSFECPQYSPGETVRVFYSTKHPELALMNTTPRQALRHQFSVILVILLLFPFVTFFAAYKEWSSEH